MTVQDEEQVPSHFGSRSIRETRIPQVPIIVPFSRAIIAVCVESTTAGE